MGGSEDYELRDEREATMYVTLLSIDIATYLQIARIVLHVYPGICTFTAVVLAILAAYDMISSWSQTVRDKEFLVEMRLQNLESDQEGRTKLEAAAEMTPVEEDEED